MAEIKLTRIKSIYGDIKGLLSQIPSPEKDMWVKEFTVETFNEALDELTRISETDYSAYKVPKSQRNHNFIDRYESKIVRGQMGRVVSRLEEEYSFGIETDANRSPSIAIFNKNQNEISLQINYTINGLIEKYDNEECKEKLRNLRDELEKPSKNWETIKSILIWILNFSKDLFLEIIPIILQKKI
ncbi:MAG: hypothetical protein PHG69_00030 [Candidatus Omnitrophica bacterium]|nr:hypothetical protein [Candidatus Omnitrophota bacterium]